MRYMFLGLLARKPAHGYELKQLIESLFGAVLPTPAVGQIYTTLQRLEQRGLLRSSAVPQEGRPDKRVYELTPRGREAVAEWLDTPVAAPDLRDDFFVKLAVRSADPVSQDAARPNPAGRNPASRNPANRNPANSSAATRDPAGPAGETLALIDGQRNAYLVSLRRMNDLLAGLEAAGNEIGSLLAEGMILHLEADLKWLDLCEDRLVTGGAR